jgi:DNA-binding CsgD family transcriptional regulator
MYNFNPVFKSEYQYKLDNYSKWSDWSASNLASFKNLPSGDYTFKVRSRIGKDNISETLDYSFTIERPFYLTNIMIGIYIIILIFIILIIHVIYKQYYKRQKRKMLEEANRELELKELEAQRKIMRINNERLEQDIDSKNRELAISTMSLVKKNEFLARIKSDLKQVNQKDQKLDNVLKTINKNLNNTDDWSLFEEAFNNADKDFLKKIKSKHSALTPNDLRLCAYLRLNLTSKEIAPLFNISTRSVEVKRYRLRKKMDLSREASLTNYILEI